MSFESIAGGFEQKRKKRFSMESFRNFVARRESIPNLEQLEQESQNQEHVSNVAFALLEKEPRVQESLKKSVTEAFPHDSVQWNALNTGQQDAIMAGNFTLGIESNTDTNQDTVTLYPEGNVAEKIPLSSSLTKTISGSLT
jgi:hypothetical protein